MGRRKKKVKLRLDRRKNLWERFKSGTSLMFRLTLVLLIIGAFFYAERSLLFFLYESSYFTVKEINVFDLPEEAKKKLLSTQTVSDLTGENIFLIDSDKIEESLEAIPTIKNVRLRKRLPNTIEISALERVAVASVTAINFYLFDIEGWCVGRMPPGEFPPDHMPILSGLDAQHVLIGQEYPGRQVREGVDLMRILREGTFPGLDEISEYHYDEEQGWILIFDSGAEVIVGKKEFADRLTKLHFLYTRLEGFKNLKTADLRFHEQIPYEAKAILEEHT